MPARSSAPSWARRRRTCSSTTSTSARPRTSAPGPVAEPRPDGPDPQRAGIVRDSLGVGIATGLYGVSFGAVAVGSGLSVAQTCVLSLLMFTGGSQFAFVGVLAGGGTPVSGAATALLLGTRNTLYGLRLAPLLAWTGVRRLGAAQLLIDESSAMSVTRDTTARARTGFLVTGWSVFVLWNLFTLVGALAGQALGDPRTYGLDAAVGGAFLALLWPRLAEPRNRVIAVLAAAVALGVAPSVAVGVPVLAAGGVALLAGVLSRSPR
ncbi:AzlC family ABC transporter permease [Nocardioides lianchengensis]|nr:AzlC family ABC transporter permease [Nocardioides lianchengensis]NYG10612.1 putative branched-subunit amino acid permease [Nocardioides lianchengensis]